ncbi:MAG: rhomboid family intramembrane serine protease [Actinomycetota bacterium]|nr:rhomboid family intramembrane serine protease [Actinomycetota bacterium]
MATCFHHPSRETGRACTRCGRSACPDCLIQASVGSQCFECVKAAAPPTTVRLKRWWKGTDLLVTQAIIAITVVAYVVISAKDGRIDGEGRTSLDLALFGPLVELGDWYRLGTNAIVHFGPIHLFFNMFILYQVGQVLEPGTGHLRFLLLYVVSVLGGAAGALVLDPTAFTGGASGGVFGVAAAAALALHRRGVPFMQTAFGPLIAINLFLSFVLPNVSIGGHIGGLLAGLIAAESMLQARRIGQPALGIVGAVGVGVIAVAIAYSAL